MILFLLLACTGSPKHALGAVQGRLAPCPETPNCVNSQADPGDSEHAIAPLPLQGRSVDAALDRVSAAAATLPRSEVVAREGAWMHLTFESALWRFVDDVEVLVDPQAELVHVRSASRLGQGDLGVNRDRVEALRAAWMAPELP